MISYPTLLANNGLIENDMNITINGNHLTITEAIHNHITHSFNPLLENFDCIVSTTITLSTTNDKSNPYKADALLVVKGKNVFASATGEDMYNVIDSLSSKVAVQVKKYKEKNTSHKGSLAVKHLHVDEESIKEV